MENNKEKIYFKDSDKEDVVKFLNLVASKAQFSLNTQEVIEYFRLLSFMQKELLPKIDSHIMEITKIIEPENKE